MGGVDLSRIHKRNPTTCNVPARMGGGDLSMSNMRALANFTGVPARMGGVDLSGSNLQGAVSGFVPARMGGVDLSRRLISYPQNPVWSPPAWAGWI